MKKVLLFEDFVSEATNVKDIAKKILGELDDNAQLFPDYVPAEALSAIEAALKKNKGLIGKDAEKAAKQIRMNLEDIGILSNTFSPMDVEIMIMNHLNESVDESINPATFDKLVKDLAYSMPNHTKYDDEVGPSEEQIMAAMKKYQKDLYKYTNDAQKKEAVDKVLQILTESVNEAKSFEIGDSFEYIPNKGSIYTITRKMAFGQKWIITGDKNPDNKFILNNAEINQWIKDGKLVSVDESLDEATTSWAKMMKGVRAGESGPWSLVAIENNKVVGQKIDIRIKDMLPAHFEAMRKEFPKAKIHIEDGTGMVVWNESVNEGFFGPFIFNDKTDTEKLKEIYNDALDGYANWQRGFEYPKADYKKAYQEAEKILKKRGVKVDESFNEAKELDRDAMMAMMSDRYKIKHVRTTEEFDGQTGGIWMAADNGETLSAGKIFDYYNNSAKYKGGVLKNVVAAAEKAGWWFSWNDPGTIMLWPKK